MQLVSGLRTYECYESQADSVSGQEPLENAVGEALHSISFTPGRYAELMKLIESWLVEDDISVIDSCFEGHIRTKGGEAQMSALINGYRCDPSTAEQLFEYPGGDDALDAGHHVHLSTVLYRAPEGHCFTVRPLTPEEAAEWLCRAGDEAEARKQFPELMELMT